MKNTVTINEFPSNSKNIAGVFFLVDPHSLAGCAKVSLAASGIAAWPKTTGRRFNVFDDGRQSHFSLGLPSLNARGIKGTFFLTIDGVMTVFPSWSSWNIAAGQGHEIASHTISHPT